MVIKSIILKAPAESIKTSVMAGFLSGTKLWCNSSDIAYTDAKSCVIIQTFNHMPFQIYVKSLL